MWRDLQLAHQQHGAIVKVVFLHRGFLFVNDPDFAKQYLQQRNSPLSKQVRFISNLTELFGVNVLTAVDDAVWKHHRAVLNTGFTDLQCVLDATQMVMQNYVSRQVQGTSDLRNINNDMSNVTLNVIGLAGFGYNFDTLWSASPCTEIFPTLSRSGTLECLSV